MDPWIVGKVWARAAFSTHPAHASMRHICPRYIIGRDHLPHCSCRELPTNGSDKPLTDRGIAIEATTIVVRGSFNPAIFTPSWFKDQGLVGSAEIEEQQIDIITRDISVFRMGWLSCHVTQDGLQLSASAPEEFERLRDAALAVLRLLSHTPISAVGLNRDFHTTMNSMAQLHAIGDAISPKAIWNNTLEMPGLRSATLWGVRTDGYGGHVQVTVEPSTRVPQSVYVAINDHFTLSFESTPTGTRDAAWDLTEEGSEETAQKIPVAVRVLLEQWSASLERAEAARQNVVRLAGHIQ